MALPGAKDLLAVLEAAYAGGPDEDAWLRDVLAAAGPWMDRGRGAAALRVTHLGDTLWLGDVFELGEPAPSGIWPGWRERVHAMWSDPATRRLVRPFYPAAPVVSTFLELAHGAGGCKEDYVESRAIGPSYDFADAMVVVAGNPSGHGCVLFSITDASADGSIARWTRPERALWTRVAAHIAAGYRLLRKEAPVDAILDPDGKVQHLEPDAVASLQSLASAVRAVDRARGALRRTDPDRAVAIWTGLVDGRWTLVDHFDHDGRRFVVAKRNPPDAREWHTLTENERAVLHYAAHGHPHKLIAYELGITVATVAGRLASAARKVGAESRLDLVRAYRSATSGQGR
jgi:DNA-binding CsgD family transcriptional regulator